MCVCVVAGALALSSVLMKFVSVLTTWMDVAKFLVPAISIAKQFMSVQSPDVQEPLILSPEKSIMYAIAGLATTLPALVRIMKGIGRW